MKCIISPHDISLPLSLASSYPQSSLMPDHGETLWNCSSQNCRIFFFSLLYFCFSSGIFLYFTFCWFLVAVVCETPLHVSMFTGSLMHIPAQRFGFSAVQMLNIRSVWRFSWIVRFNGNFIAMKSRLWWQNEGVFLSVLMSEVFVVLLTTRVSDKPVWTSPK